MVLAPIPIHKLSRESAKPSNKASLQLISLDLSRSKENSLLLDWIIIKIPIHNKKAEPIYSQIFVEKLFFSMYPISPEKIFTNIEIKNKMILSICDNFIFLSP